MNSDILKVPIRVDVSVIVPIYNGERWIDECFQAILSSDLNLDSREEADQLSDHHEASPPTKRSSRRLTIEVSVYNDSSTDNTLSLLQSWKSKFASLGISLILGGADCQMSPASSSPGGVGKAKNLAVKQSQGDFLCFQDVDDVMTTDRIREQFMAAKHLEMGGNVSPISSPHARQSISSSSTSSFCHFIVGSRFKRSPPDSTRRFTDWANNLTPSQLTTQIYTANGPTVIMPTWFLSRSAFDNVEAGFPESGKGCPEDYVFFLEHIRRGGKVFRCDETLLTYRYHERCETFSVEEKTIWDLRIAFFQENVMGLWGSDGKEKGAIGEEKEKTNAVWTIWNAGKQGRKFYRSLSLENKRKIGCFCDVDAKKLKLGFYTHEESDEKPKPRIPIVHFSAAKPPIVICVKQDLSKGVFEENLASLHLEEGKDYFFFS